MLVEISEREIAARELCQTDAKGFDRGCLFLRHLRALFGNLRLRLSLGARELGLTVDIGLLTFDRLSGFRAGFLVGQHFEAFDSIGHVADLVLAVEAGQHDGEVALGDLQHGLLDPDQRSGHSVRHHAVPQFCKFAPEENVFGVGKRRREMRRHRQVGANFLQRRPRGFNLHVIGGIFDLEIWRQGNAGNSIGDQDRVVAGGVACEGCGCEGC